MKHLFHGLKTLMVKWFTLTAYPEELNVVAFALVATRNLRPDMDASVHMVSLIAVKNGGRI